MIYNQTESIKNDRGRPRLSDTCKTVMATYRLPDTLRNAFEVECRRIGRSQADVTRELIEAWLYSQRRINDARSI